VRDCTAHGKRRGHYWGSPAITGDYVITGDYREIRAITGDYRQGGNVEIKARRAGLHSTWQAERRLLPLLATMGDYGRLQAITGDYR
jgi:hypothetical protein